MALIATSDWPGCFLSMNRANDTCVHLGQNGGGTSTYQERGWMSEMNEYEGMGRGSRVRWSVEVCPAQQSCG